MLFLMLTPWMIPGSAAGVRAADGSEGATAFPFTQEFAYSPYPDEQGHIINTFLQKIAEGTGRLRVYTSYRVSGRLDAVFTPDQQGRCNLRVVLDGLGLSGDLIYKDFSLEKVLLPDRMSFNMEIYSGSGQLIYRRFFENRPVPEKGNLFHAESLPFPCPEGGWYVHLSDLGFFYSYAVYSRFSDWLGVLESYYDAGRSLDGVPELLRGLDASDPERLILDEFMLCEAEQVLQRARYAPFYAWFEAEDNDPAGVFSRISDFEAVTGLLRRQFNQSISRIDSMFFEKGEEAILAGDHAGGRRHLESALVYNPFHPGANIALATLDHGSENHLAALSRLGHVLGRIYPSGLWKEKSHLLAGEVLNAVFENVEELTADGRFLDALHMLESPVAFCHTAGRRYPCPDKLQDLLILAHNGMFRSFITVSERALRSDNLGFCVTYLRSALKYQEANARFVRDEATVSGMMQRVIARYFERAATLWVQGDVDAAKANAEAAESLCAEFDFLHCEGFPRP